MSLELVIYYVVEVYFGRPLPWREIVAEPNKLDQPSVAVREEADYFLAHH